MNTQFLRLILVFTAAGLTAAEMPAPKQMPSMATETMPGLKVGAKAPNFSLSNTTGTAITLSSLLEKGPVALVFVRSADWCPFCRKQLQDLQKSLADIQASGVQLVALSYDSLATNAVAAGKLGLTFSLLSDPGSKVIDAYGIRNEEAKGRGVGIPHPTVFIVDRDGFIRVKLMRDGYRERPESAEIIAGSKSLHVRGLHAGAAKK